MLAATRFPVRSLPSDIRSRVGGYHATIFRQFGLLSHVLELWVKGRWRPPGVAARFAPLKKFFRGLVKIVRASGSKVNVEGLALDSTNPE
jgi:hypothetical protein